MVECIFTLDYEIYGNGEGSLLELVYEPAEKLKLIFEEFNARFVVFVEVAELERMEAERADSAIDRVIQQIRDLYGMGFEIALHLHPQWCNARRVNGKWALDYSEYNLCTLPRERMCHIVANSIAFLRRILGASNFTPFSFRAGNWLFQPTGTIAQVLAEYGVRIDSSVFKGGRQRQHNLDYRNAPSDAYYWRFSRNVALPDPQGDLLEFPIYTQMVPFWRMLTAKRVGLQRKSSPGVPAGNKVNRYLGLLRPRYPLKFDFCRMTLKELTGVVEEVLRCERINGAPFRPIVAIGHTKDLVDFDTVHAFLSYLAERVIPVSTLEKVYCKCDPGSDKTERCSSMPA